MAIILDRSAAAQSLAVLVTHAAGPLLRRQRPGMGRPECRHIALSREEGKPHLFGSDLALRGAEVRVAGGIPLGLGHNSQPRWPKDGQLSMGLVEHPQGPQSGHT